jgi:type IV secretion system protein TrbL
VAFLTATLIVIDMTLAGLFWAMSHATGQGEDVIAKLIRKVLYVGAFAYIIGNFNMLAGIVFRSFAGLGLTASGSTLSMGNFLQPGRLAKVGIDAGAPILDQIGELGGLPRGVRPHRRPSWCCSSPGWWSSSASSCWRCSSSSR